MEQLSAFIVLGFLESGKTSLIRETVTQDGFSEKGNTLVIVCEEGIEEYDPIQMGTAYTAVEYIEKIEDFNPTNIDRLIQAHKPDRLIIEFNGMWDINEVDMPSYINISQIVMMVDASTFDMYFNNMRQKMVTMIQASDAMIFNRANESMNLLSMKRNSKLANPNTQIMFEGENGPINSSFEEDLPYDVHKSIIEINDEDFGIWFFDAMELRERYANKIVKLTAQVYKPKGIPEEFFIPGRVAMTCCSNDLTVLGFPAINETKKKVKEGEWVKITAKLEYVDSIEEGPMMHVIDIGMAYPIEEPITKF